MARPKASARSSAGVVVPGAVRAARYETLGVLGVGDDELRVDEFADRVDQREAGATVYRCVADVAAAAQSKGQFGSTSF